MLSIYLFIYSLGSTLDKLVSSLSDIQARLDSRKRVPPAVFAENMKLREETHHLGKPLKSLSLALSGFISNFIFRDLMEIQHKDIDLDGPKHCWFLFYSHSKLHPSGFSGRIVPRNVVPNACG